MVFCEMALYQCWHISAVCISWDTADFDSRGADK